MESLGVANLVEVFAKRGHEAVEREGHRGVGARPLADAPLVLYKNDDGTITYLLLIYATALVVDVAVVVWGAVSPPAGRGQL